MKVMTFLGTRPEIIRLSQVIPLLDRHCEHVLVHTGQNYDERLSDIFFEEMRVRPPDYHLGAKGTLGEQIGIILAKGEAALIERKPDAVLILGDTNSGLIAIIAKRMGIPVFHMEAGNRCFDDRVPEEVNRRIIDHSSSILMPYTQNSKQNLLREGIPLNRILVTGNPIHGVVEANRPQIAASEILDQLGIEAGRYFLVTMHRAENVDIEPRLRSFVDALEMLVRKYEMPAICSLHPRTANKIETFGISAGDERLRFIRPTGFFDFIRLEENAFCVLSDSGTVQEECCIFRVPNVTIRDVTERPETLECGSNILSGADRETILRCVEIVAEGERNWNPPPEYLAPAVANTTVKIVLGYHHEA